MNKKAHNKRGLWQGVELAYFNDGYMYNDPQISPDGNYIGYLMSTELGAHLFIRDIKTDIAHQLTSDHPLSTGTEYGGARYCWKHDSTGLIFSSKGQLYEINVDGGIPTKLHSKDLSFAPFDSKFGTVFSVEHKNNMSLGLIDNNWATRIDLDADFVYDAVVNSNGDIAVHVWSFPNMSWNGSKIILLKKSKNYEELLVAGGDKIATSQPRFSPDGNKLAFNCDENGWLNLWIANADGTDARALIDAEEEHAYSTWVTGNRNYVWTSDSKYIIHTKNIKGFEVLAAVNTDTGERTDFDLPDGMYSGLSMHNNKIVVYFEDHRNRGEIQLFDISTDNGISITKTKILTKNGIKIPVDQLSKFVKPEAISFPTKNGVAHAHLYLAPDDRGEKVNSPAIFMIHGGPTGMSMNKFQRNYQYYVSRGWAVIAINHRGSIGYGREYRECMNGHWGIFDVEDTEACHAYLKKKGIINTDKTVIMGGSAGGYTTLMVLANRPDLVSAGVNLFGVSDLLGLSEETHFLESQYDTTLIGALPEAAKAFYDRSPVNIADNITKPLLILQGADDPVVLKSQSDTIAEKAKGYVEYKLYEGEGHGFRKRENIRDMFERIDKFLKHHVLYK